MKEISQFIVSSDNYDLHKIICKSRLNFPYFLSSVELKSGYISS